MDGNLRLSARRVDEKTVKVVVIDAEGRELNCTFLTTGHAQQTADSINEAISFLDTPKEN
jgi:hypothetical protein